MSLERFGESVLRGGRIWFAGPPYPASIPNLPAAWSKVMQFLEDGIVPAARAVGADVKVPTIEDVFISELPSEISDRLRSFSKAARKSLPLDRPESDLWRGFVIGAFRMRTVIDPDQLIKWLVKEGWPRDAAMELNVQFFDQCLLLSLYVDEVSAA